MNRLTNTQIKLEHSKHPVQIGTVLGSGAQGEVYQVLIEQQTLALKWYFPKAVSEEQKSLLKQLIAMGSPSNSYLWPMELAFSQKGQGFGFIMQLRENRFESIAKLYSRRIPVNLWVLATVCMNLVDTFSDLHSKGYCYKDIKSENVFFDPVTGDVAICDCDNITIDGHDHQGILGTLGYSAPEIDLGDSNPTIRTDLHSLAVLIFKILHLHHPLEGIRETAIKSLDIPAKKKLYGKNPLFIFDPKDDSNRPDPVHHQTVLAHWPIYPTFLQRLFTQAFTVGLHTPEKRVRETVWKKAFIQLRDSLIYCSCGAQNFFDFETDKTSSQELCWNCKKPVSPPVHLCIGKESIIALNHTTQLFPHHLDTGKPFDFSTSQAEVIQHPQMKHTWGLKNLTKQPWTITLSDGKSKDVPTGKSVGLMHNTTIYFGNREGTIINQSHI